MFFSGNYALRCSVQAASLRGEDLNIVKRLLDTRKGKDMIGTAASDHQKKLVSRLRSEKWTEIVPFTPLGAGVEETRHNNLNINREKVKGKQFTHIRLNIFPDGGVARFRVYGNVIPTWPANLNAEVDLAAASNGGSVVSFSDAHYGRAANLIAPGRARTMGEGWETARKPDRPPIIDPAAGRTRWSDWVVLSLGSRGIVDRIMIDTNHFKGNFPESCQIEALDLRKEKMNPHENYEWFPLLRRSQMKAHCERFFTSDTRRPITHIRITIYPDGGISRVRLFGRRRPL
jgi:allantoicase